MRLPRPGGWSVSTAPTTRRRRCAGRSRWRRDTGAEVVPVCAWHVPLPIFALAGRRVADVDRMGLRATAEVAATETIDLVGAGDAVADLLVVEGHPSDALLGLTGPGQVVVVGRRGISEIRHRVLGSVSRDLATHADGPRRDRARHVGAAPMSQDRRRLRRQRPRAGRVALGDPAGASRRRPCRR